MSKTGRRIVFWGLAGIALVVAVEVVNGRVDRRSQEVVATIPPAGTETAALPLAVAVLPNAEPAQPAWLRNAVAASPAEGKARIAIVMDGLGADAARTQRAIKLPARITLSFNAQGVNLAVETKAAREAGHELLLHLPIEGGKVSAADVFALSADQPPDELQLRLRWDLARFAPYLGVDSHMYPAFAANAQSVSIVMQEVQSRGLLYFDARAATNDEQPQQASQMGLPYVARDMFVDGEMVAGPVEGRLKQLEAMAKERGAVVAVTHPHDITLEALARWLPTLEQKGLVLVPLSDVAKTRLAAR